MSAVITQITASPKLRGRPIGGWGHYVDANGADCWRLKTGDGYDASMRFFYLLKSEWWPHMPAPERAAFHRSNCQGFDAEATRDYRTYVEYMEVKLRQDLACEKAPAKDKTPNGANR